MNFKIFGPNPILNLYTKMVIKPADSAWNLKQQQGDTSLKVLIYQS